MSYGNRGSWASASGANAELAKGHQGPLPERTDVVWLLYLAFESYLPRWQAARR